MRQVGRRILAIAVCFAAATANAQTNPNPRRMFVDVPLRPDWDDRYDDSVPGATWGSGLAFGLDWGRRGLEFDVGVPQWHVESLRPKRYQYVGRSFGWQRQGHFYESSQTERRRSIDMTLMHRVNVPLTRRVTLTWLI